MKALNADLIIVSDIHIRRPDDDRAQGLIKLVENLTVPPQYFVLLGDIFDFFHGGMPYFHRSYAKVQQALTDLSERGTKVLFIEGNHEFALNKACWPGVQMITEVDTHVELRCGTRFTLTHGDRIAMDKGYRAFRGLIKSRPVLVGTRWLIPAPLLDAYSLKHAAVSRQVNRPLNHEKILGKMRLWADASPASDYFVFGHDHIPYAENHGQSKLVCLPSWDHPNALVFRQGVAERWFLGQNDEVEPQPLCSFLSTV